MNRLLFSSLASLTSATYLFADTPVQPWSGFKVHDKERPNPAKVENSGCVVVDHPADADVVFSGKDTQSLTKKWPVKDGVMIASKLGDNKTKKEYGDCQVHIEWRIPAGRKVKGQSGGNSGIFLMDRYEVQIQESHTNVTYADGQAGAMYGQYPPLKNASAPQGQWNSYDIIFTAPRYKGTTLLSPARITVIHNGVVVQANQAYKGPTKWRKIAQYPDKHPKKAPIRLQWHSDPVEYRNFWVRDLSLDQTKKVTE